MKIPLAAVEPGDLVAVHLTDDFTIELRTPPSGEPTVIQNGRRFLEAWKTVPRFAAVASPDDTVELLQRRRQGDPEPMRHPHGWAIIQPDLSVPLHYFQETESVCGDIIGYGGLCYPTWVADYFPEDMTRCPSCLTIVEAERSTP